MKPLQNAMPRHGSAMPDPKKNETQINECGQIKPSAVPAPDSRPDPQIPPQEHV